MRTSGVWMVGCLSMRRDKRRVNVLGLPTGSADRHPWGGECKHIQSTERGEIGHAV